MRKETRYELSVFTGLSCITITLTCSIDCDVLLYFEIPYNVHFILHELVKIQFSGSITENDIQYTLLTISRDMFGMLKNACLLIHT